MPQSVATPPRRLVWARALRRSRDAQTWRLASGLLLFAFSLTHFLNHGLGHVSLEAMEQMQEVRRAVWRSWPGSILLYGSFALHAGLALWKLARRRSWRLPPWDGAQIALGLAIPLLAVGHVVGTRGLNACCGFDDRYTTTLRILWPDLAPSQSLLLVVVWLHAMIGLHFWLRAKEWYRAWSPALLVAAVLIPTLSITGFIESARRVSAMTFPESPLPGELVASSARILEWARRHLERLRTDGCRSHRVASLECPAQRASDRLPGRPHRAGDTRGHASRDESGGRHPARRGLRRPRQVHDVPRPGAGRRRPPAGSEPD